MCWWDEQVVPRLADAALKGEEIGEVRRVACAPLSGRVLELGFGGGLLDGQRLGVADATYDSVLTTFTLCTIPDPGAALVEVRRVLRPGGVLCFLEHGLSSAAGVARWQRRLDPVQRRVTGGCHLSRDVPALVGAAGLSVTDLWAGDLPGATVLSRPFLHGFRGTATRLT